MDFEKDTLFLKPEILIKHFFRNIATSYREKCSLFTINMAKKAKRIDAAIDRLELAKEDTEFTTFNQLLDYSKDSNESLAAAISSARKIGRSVRFNDIKERGYRFQMEFKDDFNITKIEKRPDIDFDLKLANLKRVLDLHREIPNFEIANFEIANPEPVRDYHYFNRQEVHRIEESLGRFVRLDCRYDVYPNYPLDRDFQPCSVSEQKGLLSLLDAAALVIMYCLPEDQVRFFYTCKHAYTLSNNEHVKKAYREGLNKQSKDVYERGFIVDIWQTKPLDFLKEICLHIPPQRQCYNHMWETQNTSNSESTLAGRLCLT